MPEAIIFASTKQQYDNRLFIKSPDQYMKIPNSEQFMYTICYELGIFINWTCDSMNNLLSCCGLIEVRMSSSEKDLPVFNYKNNCQIFFQSVLNAVKY